MLDKLFFFPSRILHIKIINYQGNCTEYTTATEAAEAEAATCISPLIRSVGRDEMLKISCSTAENMRHKLCYYFLFALSRLFVASSCNVINGNYSEER